MHHEAHILLVNAHSKGCSCDNDIVAFVPGKPSLLGGDAIQSRETSVVWDCTNLVGAQAGRKLFAGRTEGGVDYARDCGRVDIGG